MSFGIKHTKGKKRQRQHFDAEAAFVYLGHLQSTDPAMFWRHTVDQKGRLEHLFWCDGTSQKDYAVFGDVLAFDTTYRKNKYMSPLVMFSGVNHHNQTTLFASAFVANETEETYVWLLEQFLAAMKGKTPISVITDDKVAMRSAIRRVFPNAYHRLCGFHLLQNAKINVKNPRFVEEFKKCMFEDYEVGEFKHRWFEMVEEFGLEDNNWVSEMYKHRKMWATAHIRGHFFADYRTTSRCKGLRSQLGKFVDSHKNLTEFLQHFMRFRDCMRNNELEADFKSWYGEPVMVTPLEAMEKSASKVFTRAIFLLFRPMIEEACGTNVVGGKQAGMHYIFAVDKFGEEGKEWHVSFWPSTLEIKCSCLKMESLGIPCYHLIGVMKHLHIAELPKCIVLDRWTKGAKETTDRTNYQPSICQDSVSMTLHDSLVNMCKQMCNLRKLNFVSKDTGEKVTCHTEMLQAKNGRQSDDKVSLDPQFRRILGDTAGVRSKECNATSLTVRRTKGKEIRRCGVCRAEGHNRRSCPAQIYNANADTCNTSQGGDSGIITGYITGNGQVPFVWQPRRNRDSGIITGNGQMPFVWQPRRNGDSGISTGYITGNGQMPFGWQPRRNRAASIL